MDQGEDKKEAGKAGEASSNADTGAGTPKPLKAKPKIVKKKIVKKIVKKKVPVQVSAMEKKVKGSPQIQGEKVEPKSKTDEGNKENSEGNKEDDNKTLQGQFKDVKPSTEDTTKEKSTNTQKDEEKEPVSQQRIKKNSVSKEKQQKVQKMVKEEPASQKGNKEISVSKENRQKGKKTEEKDKKTEERDRKTEEKEIVQKGKQDSTDSKEKHQKDQKNEKKEPNSQKRKREMSTSKGNEQKDQGKDALGGLIFLCNGKTKPDCFRYGVMGVSQNKKDLVMSIKPGLKLFLYDFDLRLMYGIYKASSAGGMKLEPSAFGGGFPYQVRFKVLKDCLPLAERDFKNAIKDNYHVRRDKFKTELTVDQVKKLTELFRPVGHHQANVQPLKHAPLSAPILHAPPMPVKLGGDRGEPLPQAHGEQHPRGSYSFDEPRRYYMPPEHQRETQMKYPASSQGDVAPKQKISSNADPLFLSEKEYRAYGLKARRCSPPPATAPIPASAKPSGQDPYYPYHSGSVSDRYQVVEPYPRRETYVTDPSYAGRRAPDYATDPSYARRRATDISHTIRFDEGHGLYSTYASNALSDYNQKNYLGHRPEQESSAVSSRYAFAGPSLGLRAPQESSAVSSRYAFAGPSFNRY